LLADGRGTLVPFGAAIATGNAIAALLVDDAHRLAVREHAHAGCRSMTWERTAERYLAAFETARDGRRTNMPTRPDHRERLPEKRTSPQMQMVRFLSMSDDISASGRSRDAKAWSRKS
jgi:hypothetical protein